MKNLIKNFLGIRLFLVTIVLLFVIFRVNDSDELIKNAKTALTVASIFLIVLASFGCVLMMICVSGATTKEELRHLGIISIALCGIIAGILMLTTSDEKLTSEVDNRNVGEALLKTYSYIFLSIVAFLIVVPFIQLILNSFKSSSEYYSEKFFPTEWHFSNYIYVFQETVMARSFINTFMYIIPPVLCGTFMSSLAAYGFARLKFPGKNIVFSAMMSTLVIPNVIIMIPAYVMFRNFYKWWGTPLPVIVPALFGGTTCMFFMLQYIRTIPTDMEEAAMIDGLSRGGMFVNIIMPLIVPAFVAQAILTFSGQYNDYLTPLLYLSGDESLYTVQLAINQMNSGHNIMYEKLLAACTIALIPTIILFLSAQKTFTEGITLTGVK